MAGIYIHIPFCKSRCIYCDFYKETDESQKDTLVDSICKEAHIRKSELNNESVKTIYFGGGTPSRLDQNHFEQIFDTLFSTYSIDTDAEITMEANPDDLTTDFIHMITKLPFNRLSIGIQSFDDKELKFLSRRHTSEQAISAVKNSQTMDFDNISIDLMYGLPGQTLEIWQENLNKACELDITHISAYHLIYEEKTRMYSLLQSKKITPVNDDTSNQMFTMLIDSLVSHNFLHYEISNFCKPGYFSKHNSSYWRDDKYLGLGPAAHSFDGLNRSWNIASLNKYIEGVNRGPLQIETEHLNESQKYNEFILKGLRTMWGIDLSILNNKFGKEFREYCLVNSAKFIKQNLLIIEDDTLKLTREGIFISDGIMSELMWINNNDYKSH